MNYDESLAYFDRLGNEVLTMKFGLETIRKLLESLGRPHLKYPSVLIAGTNGKGSVACFLNSVCSASGIRNGVFTSPHLIRPEERIVVDDQGFTNFRPGVGPLSDSHRWQPLRGPFVHIIKHLPGPSGTTCIFLIYIVDSWICYFLN